MKEPDDYFVINLDSLIEQWSTFARDYWRKACALADARAEWERVKRIKEVVVAELDKDIRLHPDEYGLEKLTEGAIEKTVILQKRYQDVHEEVIKAKHSMDIHQAYVDALDVMKKGLESSTYLWQSSYSAEPKARGDVSRALSEAKIDSALGRRRA